MDLPSLYIGIAIIAAILLPFFLISRRQKKRENLLQKKFIENGLKYGVEITETEQWKDRNLGLDSVKKKLIFRHFINQEMTETLIDLSNFNRALLETSMLGSADSATAFDKINVRLKSKTGNKDEMISFFKSETDSIMYFELQLAEKWVKLINEVLN